jgi:peptide/nickel transport system substrate-binding protein
MVGAATVACSGGKPSGSSNSGARAAKQPKRGGLLTYPGGSGVGSYDIEGYGFDPASQLEFFAKAYTLFYERLLAYNVRTRVLEPELAQKWEQPSQTEYVFHLQPGVKWQNKPPVNGRTLTAEDILYSLGRVRSDDPHFLYRSLLEGVDKLDAPDPATIRVTLKSPDVVMLSKLAIENMSVVAHELIEKDPKLGTAETAVGTGPFVMKSMSPSVGAEYVRNPDYWKPGLPYLDGVRTQKFADLLSAWSAFRAKQVDMALIPGSEVKGYVAQQGSGYQPDWYADDSPGGVVGPNVRTAPMNDARVTRALRLLLDHDELVKSWAEVQYGRGAYGSIFPTALTAWDLTPDEYRTHLEWKQPKDDAAKEAISMLNAAGYTKDKPLTFTYFANALNPAIPPAAQLMQAQWKRLSQGAVDPQLQLDSSGAGQQRLASRSFTIELIGTSTGVVDPDSWLSSMFHSGGSLNYMGWSDPQADAMIDKQRTIFDEAQRRAAVKELVLYMIDHSPSTITANRFFLQGLKPRVQDHAPEYFLNGRQYQTIWFSE